MNLFHRHKWTPLRTDLYSQLGHPITLIYEGCACGEKRMRQIDGEWTLELLGWNVYEAGFESNSGQFLIITQQPIKGQLGRLVWFKEREIV